MNLILFTPREIGEGIEANDPRARHVLDILGFRKGEPFDAAIPNGHRGRARLLPSSAAGRLHIQFDPLQPCPPPETGTLLCGLCRPQTIRKVIRDCATFGISSIHFFPTDRGEPSYAKASLWSDGEVDRLLLDAAQQAFNQRLAIVHLFTGMEAALESLPSPEDAPRTALDNYEAPALLDPSRTSRGGFVLAVGSERGWSSRERDALRSAGFSLRSLGPRVLRTETAAVVGMSLLKFPRLTSD